MCCRCLWHWSVNATQSGLLDTMQPPFTFTSAARNRRMLACYLFRVSCGTCLPAQLEGGCQVVRHYGSCGGGRNDGDVDDKVSLGLLLISFASEISAYLCNLVYASKMWEQTKPSKCHSLLLKRIKHAAFTNKVVLINESGISGCQKMSSVRVPVPSASLL